MTEQRNKTGAETDTLVSQAYRDLAEERAPEHLNRKILKAAAQEARPRYSRLIAWTRPMAWAATVMLSVALVLEVTRTPSPEVVSSDEMLGKYEVQAPRADASQVAPLEEEEARKRTADLPASPEFKLRDEDILEQGKELARMQEGSVSQPSLDAAVSAEADQEITVGRSLPAAAAFSAPLADCDEDAVATPETWLECIEDLEDAGEGNKAREERARLAEAFPGFDPN